LFGDESERDFTALDTLIPDLVYGCNHRVSVLNLSESSFESIKPLLHEAHAIAIKRVERRKTPSDSDTWCKFGRGDGTLFELPK
jgi:hypothetical protein